MNSNVSIVALESGPSPNLSFNDIMNTSSSSIIGLESALNFSLEVNETQNHSLHPPMLPKLSYTEVWSFWIAFSLITIIGLFGNGLVIVAILGSPGMRRSLMNLLLLNLAVADFGNLFFCSVDWMQILIIQKPVWLLHRDLCPAVRYMETVFLYASLFFQVAVAVER